MLALRGFFYNHADCISQEAMGPDLRKYTLHDHAEFPRYFINLEAYGEQAITTLPRTPAKAQAKLDAATLEKNGALP